MKLGTPLRQRDLILLPIPFTDLTSNKRRPAVVISNDEYNHKTQDAMVVGVTSNIQRKEYSVLLRNLLYKSGDYCKEIWQN